MKTILTFILSTIMSVGLEKNKVFTLSEFFAFHQINLAISYPVVESKSSVFDEESSVFDEKSSVFDEIEEQDVFVVLLYLDCDINDFEKVIQNLKDSGLVRLERIKNTIIITYPKKTKYELNLGFSGQTNPR